MREKRSLSNEKKRKYLTPNEVAEMMMVSPVTIRQWAARGDLPALVTPGGHRRFVRSDIEDFARQRGLALLPADREEIRILIVDDDRPFSSYLNELLSMADNNIKLDFAYDGFAAGQKVETFQPNIILLDLMMPGMDGYEVCQRLKADPNTKSLRIIAMTGYPSPENIERILKEGAEACLAKPINTDELFNLLGIEKKQQMHAKA